MNPEKPIDYKDFKSKMKQLRQVADSLKIMGPVSVQFPDGEILTETQESMHSFLDEIESNVDIANGKIPLSEYKE